MMTALFGGVRRSGRVRYQGAFAAIRHYAQPAILNGLKANGSRVWEDIHYTSQWGTGLRWGDGPNDTGMSRLALSDTDKEARDWFVDTTRSLGCKVTVDNIGNIFAYRPGKSAGLATCAGSHLDTQPTGGRYDGVLGVCAGIEMLRTLHENKLETEYPVGVINWTNEEGARFPLSMMASGVWAEKITLQVAHDLVEVGDGGRTVKDELKRIGYLGDVTASFRANPIAAHFELHIEQGPKLENAKQKIGVVTGVQSYNWFDVTVTGRDCHTGTTPFEARSDAMLATAKFIASSHDIARKLGGLASTGIVKAFPGSVNTVPGRVTFSLDIRASTDEHRQEIFSRILTSWKSQCPLAPLNGVRFEMKSTFDSPATYFHEDCIKCVRDSATANFGDSQADLVSGAGHDSVFASKCVPTTMIFVPCKNGVSHHPEEFCSFEDCTNGTQVLMESVLTYDQRRTH